MKSYDGVIVIKQRAYDLFKKVINENIEALMNEPIEDNGLTRLINRKVKQDSKRRWIARFNLGKPIPDYVIYNHRLEKRLTPYTTNINYSTRTKKSR